MITRLASTFNMVFLYIKREGIFENAFTFYFNFYLFWPSSRKVRPPGVTSSN